MVAPRRLILLPGLAADERMYDKLDELPIEVVTPRLLIPLRHETMADYALRHAEWLAVEPTDVVGGCSFGSMVASEICRQRTTCALVLLSGALSSAALTPAARRMKAVSTFLPVVIARPLLASRRFLRAVFGADAVEDADGIELARQMVLDTPAELLLRGRELATGYFSDAKLRCEVYAQHGARDRVLTPPVVEHCALIDDAGHGMIISHPHQVSSFLRRLLQQLGTTQL